MKINDNCTLSDISNKLSPTRIMFVHTSTVQSRGCQINRILLYYVINTMSQVTSLLLAHISQVMKCQHNITIIAHSPLYKPTALDCGFTYPSNRITIKHDKTCATAQSMGANVNT